jgi:hypothetical protein
VKPGISVSAWRSARSRIARADLRDEGQQVVDLGPEPEADVGGDLVVARARGVQPLAGVAGELREAVLDIEVDVLALDRPGELPGAHLLEDLRHAAFDRLEVRRRQDADFREHARVRERALDVELGEPPVEADRGVEALRQAVDRLAKPSRPCLAGAAGLSSCCMESVAMAKLGTVASINQTGTGIRLPNFCNHGVMLRAPRRGQPLRPRAAVMRSASPDAFAPRIPVARGVREPALILSLLTLCARAACCTRWVRRSWVAVLFFELALSWFLFHVVRGLIPGPPGMPFAQVGFLALFITGCTPGLFRPALARVVAGHRRGADPGAAGADSVRTSSITASTPSSRSSARSRGGPSARSRTWRTCFASSWRTIARSPHRGRRSS